MILGSYSTITYQIATNTLEDQQTQVYLISNTGEYGLLKDLGLFYNNTTSAQPTEYGNVGNIFYTSIWGQMTVNLFGTVSLELSALKHSPGEIFAKLSFSKFKIMI